MKNSETYYRNFESIDYDKKSILFIAGAGMDHRLVRSLKLPDSKFNKPLIIDLIDINMLNKMKKNAIIINTSRGGVINEKDLDKALKEKIIFGAGLDVFEKEPPDLNNPLLKNEKALLSPHSSSFTNECKKRMSVETVQNIIDFFENKTKPYMIVKL